MDSELTGRRRLVGFGVALLAATAILVAAPAGAQTAFVDSGGRSVTLPAHVDKVLAAGPPAAVVLYTLAPEKLMGWVRAPDAESLAYLAPRWRNLPVQGRITGRNGLEPAAVKALGADLIVDFGDVTPAYVELANRTQAATGVAYVLIDGQLGESAKAYRSLGQAVQSEARGQQLASASSTLLAEVAGKLPTGTAAAQKRVYIARGPDGNETYGAGAFTDEVLARAGAVNIARDWGRGLLKDIAPERVREANPDMVIALDPYFLEVAGRTPAWKAVGAIAAGHLRVAPRRPFGWLDEPPSVNRLIGVRWLAGVLYPERFGPTRQAVGNFFRTFYQVDLGDAALDKLLDDSRTP
jgi:iron complex transport system substrate-binding protein